MATPYIPSPDERAARDGGVYRVDSYWRTHARPAVNSRLTARWTPLVPHPEQVRLWQAPERFCIVAGGRRSGKTERAKRKGIGEALRIWPGIPDPRIIIAAPTRAQVKDLYWEDMKALTPRWALDTSRRDRGISESELTIWFRHGPRIRLVGMDSPHRIEGSPIDFAILDEFAKMKPAAWRSAVRPALDTIGRPGRAWFVGRPAGKNHFWELRQEYGLNPARPQWGYFHWKSSEVMSAESIEAAKDDSDSLNYAQEYDAEFVTFADRAYYEFDAEIHCAERVPYDPAAPLDIAFDFNVSPGVAVYTQERPYRGQRTDLVAPIITAIIGEVYIPDNSNTRRVCERIIADWGPGGRLGHHQGMVRVYGDPSGGSRHVSSDRSSWQQIDGFLRPAFPGFRNCVAYKQPAPRDCVNALNHRLRSARGTVRMLLDIENAPRTALDLAEVTVLPGTAGEIDKDDNPDLTHLSDALSYLVHERHPVQYGSTTMTVAAI